MISELLRRHCKEKTAAESKVAEQEGTISRMTAEISCIESVMTAESQCGMTVQLPGEILHLTNRTLSLL